MEKRKPLSEMSDQEKLNYLIEKVERIDRTINPSFGRRMLSWGQSHWVVVLGFLGTFSILFSLWDEIQIILNLINGIHDAISQVQQSASGVGSRLGETKESLLEGVKKIFDFWR